MGLGDLMLVSREEIIEVNLHNMHVLEAKAFLELEVSRALPEIKEVHVIHGYKKGQAILNMVRREFRHKRVTGMRKTFFNLGMTILELY
ncbi:MAG: DNA mismatch repair protein MutS [Oscillospiraceae bacterium]|nr:DNA mismatch repair protein MutS [Oscillospiraceae bacterium]